MKDYVIVSLDKCSPKTKQNGHQLWRQLIFSNNLKLELHNTFCNKLLRTWAHTQGPFFHGHDTGKIGPHNAAVESGFLTKYSLFFLFFTKFNRSPFVVIFLIFDGIILPKMLFTFPWNSVLRWGFQGKGNRIFDRKIPSKRSFKKMKTNMLELMEIIIQNLVVLLTIKAHIYKNKSFSRNQEKTHGHGPRPTDRRLHWVFL